MTGILGFDFYPGRQVEKPEPIDFTLGPAEVDRRRKGWYAEILDAVRYEDAWAVLTTKPNGDVLLFDVSEARLFEATSWGGTVHLLLARETPAPHQVAVREEAMTTTEVEPFDTDSLDRPETRFPIEIRTTSVYTVWVEADTIDQALSRYEDSDRAADAIRDEQAQDGWIETSTSEYGPVTSHGNKFGPCQACPDCGAASDGFYSPDLEFANHAGTCRWHHHRPDIVTVYSDENRAERLGFVANCSCGQYGLPPTTFLSLQLSEVPTGTWMVPERSDLHPLLQEHVAGRRHGKNVPMGITDDAWAITRPLLASGPR